MPYKNKEDKKQNNKEYYINNKEKRSKYYKAYYKDNKNNNAVISRKNNLRRKYNLSVEEYEQLLVQQDSRCAICATDKSGGRGRFHVDHCHTTGKVRGLLCHNCNSGLGFFKDSISITEKALSYLKENLNGTV